MSTLPARSSSSPQPDEVVLHRVVGVVKVVEHGNEDVGEHVAGGEDSAFLNQQRRVARGVSRVFDDLDFRSVPGDPLCSGGQAGDAAVKVQWRLVGDLGWEPRRGARLPVRGRPHLLHDGRTARCRVARRFTEVGVPQHVVPIRMRREARYHRLAKFANVVREASHLRARDPGVDDQHAGLALHDGGVVQK